MPTDTHIYIVCEAMESRHSAWLMDLFPANPHRYSPSLFPVLLSQIGDLLCFNDFDGVDRKDMAETRRKIKNAPEQFATLLSLEVPDAEGDNDLQTSESGFGIKFTQRQRKNAKRKLRGTVVLDTKVFEEWRLPVPKSKMDAEGSANLILEELKGIWAVGLHFSPYKLPFTE